jgi:2-polyprenyl-6-methoxyphenol hydroxylase-like FAD-dependent oxidoreductase
LVVQARSLELLQKAGIADEMVKRGRTTVRAGFFSGRREVARVELDDVGADGTPYPFVLFLSQVETERAIEARLTELGVRVERPIKLESYQERADGIVAKLRHADGRIEEVSARYVIGCDGAHSAVRHAAGIPFEGAAYPQDFILADVHIDWSLEHDRIWFFLGRNGLLTVLPLGEGGLHRLIATGATAMAGADDASGNAMLTSGTAEPTLSQFQAIFDELAPERPKLTEPRWLARFRLHHRAAESYRRGRAFIAGDAAHIHSPAGGQGMNTGIQDAFNLAWKLALVLRGECNEQLLESYEAERRPVGRALLRYTDRLFSFATTRQSGIAAIRTWVMPRVVPFAAGEAWRRRLAFRFISQLGLNYEGSPIVSELDGKADAAFRKGPRAGRRAPDGLLKVNGRPSTLFSLMTEPSHHLLVFVAPGTNSEALARLTTQLNALRERHRSRLEFAAIVASGTDSGSSSVVVDADGTLRLRYGVSRGACYLIRPDGYVAFRCLGNELAPVENDLRRRFDGPAARS